jgi:hypothetical protein
MNLTSVERDRLVARMRANFALEGLQPDATDIALQIGYISGALTLSDMLAYARDYAVSRVGSGSRDFTHTLQIDP